jgi:hypothetical protein
MTSSCAGELGLREAGERTSGPNLASRDNVAHHQNLYPILDMLATGPSRCKEAETYTGRSRGPRPQS